MAQRHALGEIATNESRAATAVSVPDLAEQVAGVADAWRAAGSAPIPLDLRDKVVAAGLALGTGLALEMVGLGSVFVLLLILAGPAFTLRSVRRCLLSPRRETLAAYYVAWLYGPLGWGVYKNVRWAQVLGAALLVAVIVMVV